MSSINKKRIRRHNKQFYYAIRKHIHEMPDFRPLDTVEQMKKVSIDGVISIEGQDPWSVLNHEFEALAHNKGAEKFLFDIMREDLTCIEQSLDWFYVGFPGIFWSLTLLLAKEILYPLLISQGKYLEMVEMEIQYIKYIRDKNTAHILFIKNPSLISPKEAISRFIYEGIGMLYWILEDHRIDPNTRKGLLIKESVRKNNISMVNLLLSHPKTNPTCAIFMAIRKGYENITKEIMDNDRLIITDPHILFEYTIMSGHSSILKLILPYIKLDMTSSLCQNIFVESVFFGKDMVRVLLDDSRTDPSILNQKILFNAIKCDKENIIDILLSHPKIHPNKDHLLHCLHNKPKIMSFKSLLKDKRLDPCESNHVVLMEATARGNEEILKLLLKDPRINPNFRRSKVFREAIKQRNKEAVRILLQDLRVNPCDKNGKAIRYALELELEQNDECGRDIIHEIIISKRVKKKVIEGYVASILMDRLL